MGNDDGRWWMLTRKQARRVTLSSKGPTEWRPSVAREEEGVFSSTHGSNGTKWIDGPRVEPAEMGSDVHASAALTDRAISVLTTSRQEPEGDIYPVNASGTSSKAHCSTQQ
jgi:hypothetical protein